MAVTRVLPSWKAELITEFQDKARKHLQMLKNTRMHSTVLRETPTTVQ